MRPEDLDDALRQMAARQAPVGDRLAQVHVRARRHQLFQTAAAMTAGLVLAVALVAWRPWAPREDSLRVVGPPATVVPPAGTDHAGPTAARSRPSTIEPPGGVAAPPAPVMPPGWKSFDVLDIRLAVPPDWDLQKVDGSAAIDSTTTSLGSSPLCVNDAPGYLFIGTPRPANCDLKGRPHIAVSPSAGPINGGQPTVIGGDVKAVALESCAGCGRRLYVPVADLVIDMQISDPSLATLIESTIGYSPWHQALSDGPLVDTTDWTRLTIGPDLAVWVPAAWPIRDLSADPNSVYPGECTGGHTFIDGAAVYLGWARAPNHRCSFRMVQFRKYAIDGAFIQTGIRNDERRTAALMDRTVNGQPVMVYSRTDPVDINDNDGGQPRSSRELLRVEMFLPTASGWNMLTVGIGADPAVARTIISTIETAGPARSATKSQPPSASPPPGR